MRTKDGDTKTEKAARDTKTHGKGGGSLEKHGGVWRAVWIVNGKRYRRSTGETVRTKAEKKLREWVAPFQTKEEAQITAALVAKVEGLKQAADDMTFEAAWNLFEGSDERKKTTEAQNAIYKARFDAFRNWMQDHAPGVEIRAVTKDHAAGFRRSLSRLTAKTRNDYCALLAQLWKIVLGAESRDSNPWKQLKKEAVETHTRRELTVSELSAVLGSVTGEMRVLFALGIYTGLRLGDCVNLDWGAVDLARGFIQVRPHKTKRHGTFVKIAIPPVLGKILAETPPALRRGPLFDDLRADYHAYSFGKGLSMRIQEVFRKCGISTCSAGEGKNKNGKSRRAVDVGFHSLRHTYVSLAANAGVPLSVVQSIVGHSNAAMTEHYFHVSDSALRGAAAALPDVTGDASAAVALPPPSSPSASSATRSAAADAVEGFRAACARLAAAGLTREQWREVSGILAGMEKARRA